MTSLQKQLAVIAASSTHQLDLKAQKAAHGKSLLYEPKVAASQSFDSIYLICSEGYRDLCTLDRRFVPFSRTLFSEQSKSEDRTQMTKKENAELDSVLETFITLVGPRLLLKPAEKALEWLVRRFRVHEYNTECLVLTYLPYHATPQFLALLSILPPSPPPKLRFLFPYITPPTNPPRQAIVYTAANTPGFFAALQGYVVKALKAGHHGSTLLSFWSAVTAQAVDSILEQSQSGRRDVRDQRTEEVLLRVLPALNECLQMKQVPEALMGSYMIAIILVSKGAFQDKVLDSIMEAVIRSQEPETLEGCLMCLAVIAEERSRPGLPSPVLKRIFKIPDLAAALQALSKRSRIDRLTLGCALGALENIGRSFRPAESKIFFQAVIESGLLDDQHASLILSALLQIIRDSPLGSPEHAQLVDLVTKLGEFPQAYRILQSLTKDHKDEFESLGVSLQHVIENVESLQNAPEDEDMLDADQDANSRDDGPAIALPYITESSFLSENASESFQNILSIFEQVVPFPARVAEFLDSEALGRLKASETALLLSFLARTWCSSTVTPVKVVAVRSAAKLIKKLDSGTDLQHLIPYLLCGLSDPSPAVRRATATSIGVLSGRAPGTEKATTYHIWGLPDLYGKDTSKLSSLPKGQTSSLLSSVLVPVLEECVMDSQFIITSIRNLFEGVQITKSHQAHNIKSSAKAAFISFLASHVAHTPLLRVRFCLLPLFSFVGKSMNGTRTAFILPAIRSWCSLSAAETTSKCMIEKLEETDVDKRYLAALVGREPESADILKELVSGSIKTERSALLEAAFERLAAMWSSLKSESRLSLSQSLLEVALKQDCTHGAEELRKARSSEVLRNVKLDTAVLADLLESVPSAIQMPEGPPTKKRRRTSRNEMARVEIQSPEDVNRLLRKLTLVLELIEGSNPGEHTALFRNLFGILGDLQQLKQQSGSDLVYLHSLILGSLTPMVDQLKTSHDTSESQAAVRADLLIDCIRHSTSPQVQNAALLLIASLASWVPELVLHNLMPIFTFIGSTLLRQNDDYSAHVVDQTILRVVPQLAASLRAKHKNFLTGVSDLLLSFTAAFEHIPHHRRLKLFSELARTLGPEDSLSAIVALLVDRYPSNPAQRKFIPELLLKFPPIVTLQAFKGYLNLVTDAVDAKRNVSDTLFSLNEKQPSQVELSINNLLSSLADLATDRSLQNHINKAFKKSRDPTKPRAEFAEIIEITIRLSKKVPDSRLYRTCSRVLANCLDLLPTPDLVKTAELLLTNSDNQVTIAVVKSVEIRAGRVTQNDEQSVSSLLSFVSRVEELLRKSSEVDVKIIAVSCIDRIVERFGKKDVSVVADVARTISGAQSLSSNDDRVRILSLLCLTSIVDVLGEDAISLLPTVLPTAFKYLQESIDKDNHGLHNAVFTLLSDMVVRLSFVFTREYLVPALEIAHRSAAGDMGEACDESRRQFYQSVANHLGAKEAFTAIKATWPSAIASGYEASREHLDLLHSTIEHQTKSQLMKASSTLFNLFLDLFNLRHAVDSDKSDRSFDEEEIEQLEASLTTSVIDMTLKLNDATFRPFFVQLVDSTSSTADGKEDMNRSITLCKFLASFFGRLKSIVTSYSSYIIEPLSRLLSRLTTLTTDSSLILRNAVLNALQQSFEHDQDSFWQAPSHYSAILDPLLKQLTIDSPLALNEHVIPAITELAASTSSIDNHRQMNTVLLKYMRAEEAHTRLATVKCEQSLTDRLGEEWLGLLPEMLPFISELREDDDEMVERETQRWISMVEEILGEDLEAMLQ